METKPFCEGTPTSNQQHRAVNRTNINGALTSFLPARQTYKVL